MDDLFKSLDIDKSEWLEDIKHGDSSSASFMASVEECISERESRKFEEGLNTKVKLGMYKRFGKSVEFKKYLHGICDAGSRLLFKFRSGTHGLNEELGRHRGREGKTECSLCGNECENVSHVLWECSVYSSTRASFMKKFQEFLEDDYEDFESLENVEKSSYVLGSELWESRAIRNKEHSVLPSLPLCLPNSSFRPCVPDLNLNKSLLPASHIPCKYFLNSTLLPKRLYISNLTLVLSPSSNFLLSFTNTLLYTSHK